MRRRLGLLLALALLLACNPAAAADAIGSVTRLQGEAQGLLDGKPVALAAGTSIFMNERLTTTGKARLELTFVDGTKLTIGDSASVTVDRFLYKPRGLGNAFNAAITGPFRFISGKLDKTPASLSRVETTFATIGVRGTDFWGGPIDGESGVFLIAGAVSVTNAAGSVDLTKPRQGTDIAAPDAAPSAVTIWPKDKIARALATVNFPGRAAP